MFRSRWRKIIRDVWARKGRTTMASLAIFIGVLGVVVLVSSGDLVTKQLQKDLKADEMAMQQVFVSVPSGIDIDNAAYIQALEDSTGVTKVEGRAVYPLDWQLPDGTKFENGIIRASWEAFDETSLQPARLIGLGSYPVAGQNEIAIETRMASKYDLAVGDTLILRALGGETIQAETWTISGIIFDPYPSFDLGGRNIDNEISVFAAYEDAQYIAGATGLSIFYVRYTDFATAEDQSETFYNSIGQKTDYVPVFNYMDNPDESTILNQVRGVTDILFMMGIIAMIVSGFLVLNIVNTIVGQQRQQIGVMKSLGATRWDNFKMYMGIALFYGIIGTVPGVIVGLLLGSVMAQNLDTLAMTLIEGFSISTQGLILGIVMGLAVPVVAALVPVFLGTRVTILEAMTDVGIAFNYGKGRLSRMITAMRLPMIIRQGISNLTRKKGRMVLTWLTLTLAIAGFMGVFAIFSSANQKIAGVYDSFGYQISVSPTEQQDFDELEAIIKDVDGIRAVYPGVGAQVGLEGYLNPMSQTNHLPVIGFDPATDTFNLDYEAGTGWENDTDREGIVLTSSVARKLGKSVGDEVELSALGKTIQLEIIGVSSVIIDSGFLEWKILAQLIGFEFDGQPTPNRILVQMNNDNPSISEVDDTIDAVEETILAQGITAEYVNQVKMAEDTAKQISTFGMLFSISALVMAAVGAVGLLATLSMSVFERQKEIGVMRSIGASSVKVISQFMVEGILVGLTAWIVAVPLSYLLGKVLLTMLPFGLEGVGYDPISLLYGLIGMISIATIASLWPSLRAAHKTVSEIIRYQ